MGARTKYQVARAVVSDLVESLPESMQVGLRVYGHLGFWPYQGRQAPLPQADDPRMCTDSQLVMPIGPLSQSHRDKLRFHLAGIQPRGMTPLVYSLLKARNDFETGSTAPKAVVLVSDGEDTCYGKLEDVSVVYQGTGIKVIIHVVGFSLEGGAPREQLKEIARLGGGKYFDATNAGQLAAALKEAMKAANFVVYQPDSKTEVARGLINGPAITLKAGPYRVGLLGSAAEALAVELEDGQALELSLDESGNLVPQAGSAPAGTKPSDVKSR